MLSPTAAPPRASGRVRAIAPGLALVVGVAVVATLVATVSSTLSPLIVAIVLGAVIANVVTVPTMLQPGITFGARSLLRVGVVLLGLRLSLGDLADLGPQGVLVVAATVTVTFVGTQRVAARMGVPPDLGLMVATGYSICGASAIAAMDGVVDADEEETAYAVSLVTLCGTLSIFVLPVIAGMVGLTGEAFGVWVGGAVHDVGQVVATASLGDPAALEAATVVKLTRVVLLAPLVAIVALRRRAAGRALDPADAAHASHPPLLPLFVIGFLTAILVRSSGVLSSGALDTASNIEKAFLTAALVGLGLGVRIDRMRQLGSRPLALGMIAWVLVAGTAYLGTVIVA